MPTRPSARAMPRPIPLVEPVTIATFPRSICSFIKHSDPRSVGLSVNRDLIEQPRGHHTEYRKVHCRHIDLTHRPQTREMFAKSLILSRYQGAGVPGDHQVFVGLDDIRADAAGISR